MKSIRRFIALRSQDQSLLLRSWVWLAVIRVGLYIFSLEVLRSWIVSRTAPAPVVPATDPSNDVERVTWAVHTASRYVPGAETCLVQALATQRLLLRQGVLTRLFIGLARHDDGRFEGHAWVETGGKVVMGKAGHERFIPLTSLGERE